MWIFLLWMCLRCVSPSHGSADRVCPRKEPPPGVLVLSPGRDLVLTCRGHVRVDGVKVNLTGKNPDSNKKRRSLNVTPSSQDIPTSLAWSNETTQPPTRVTAGDGRLSHSAVGRVSTKGRLRSSDAAFTASPDGVGTTRANAEFTNESVRDAEETEVEGDYEYEYEDDEAGEEGSRVTRGVRSRPQWTWNKIASGRGDKDGGEISFPRNGASLNLSSVRLTDSGKYVCSDRGRERFSVKVVVADPPEKPSLSCYKKSPSSVILCEWTPQKPVVKPPHCYLLLSKRVTARPNFDVSSCSYSSRHSRCWCALAYNDDEQRTLHMAYLCVSSIAGIATSIPLYFTPLEILKPNPPSNVSVQQEEGHQSRLKVSWNLPTSWKKKDSHYALIYELQYRPVRPSFEHAQNQTIEGLRSYIITDAIPGVEYMIKLRAKDEFDGHWSEWSTPVYDRSWTVAVTVIDDLPNTVFDLTDLLEGLGSDADGDLIGTVPEPSQRPHFALWIAGLFVLLSVIVTAYMFRHKDRILSKLNSLSLITQFGETPPSQPPPSAPGTVATEGQALVTFDLPLYKEKEEEKEGDDDDDDDDTPHRMEAVHFDNISYFFLQRE